jgi:dTDP-4-amino-4,6-dideoxygalactose transaminase
MYIPAWPVLNPTSVFKRAGATIPFPLGSSNSSYFYVARNGIYHLMKSLASHGVGGPAGSKAAAQAAYRSGPDGGSEPLILVPDYHHGNEIYALKAAGAKLRYYPVKKNLDVDLDAIADLCDLQPKPLALYLTHFIGWPQPIDEILSLCKRKHLILIEDCALSFLSEFEGRPLGTFGAYSVFCLYKTVPVPNGGVLVANNTVKLGATSVRPCSAVSVTGPSIDLILRWVRSRNEFFGRALLTAKRAIGRTLTGANVRRVPIGDTGFDISNVNAGMSPICHTLLGRFGYEEIRKRRRRNFRIVEDILRGHVALVDKTLNDGVCPLFFPLLVKDKQIAAASLAARGIETVEFWNSGDPQSHQPGSSAEFLRRHLLELPIHQDVTPEGAEYAANQILKLGIGLPA